jgi:hypothetical protein
MDIANLLNAIGITASGAMPVIQQGNAQRIAAQRLGQIAQAAQANNRPGFSPYPAANAGTPLPNGMPMGAAPPGGAPGMPAPNGAGPMPSPVNPFAGGPGPGVAPYGGPTTAPTGDPFSYPNVVNAFFGGGNAGQSDFQAWQETEKTLRPYGQIQGRSALEGQRQEGRKELEGEKQTGRMELQQDRDAVYTTRWGLDRDEKAREADQRSSDVRLGVAQRQKAAQDAAEYRKAALEEKAREADRQSQDRRLSIDQRQQAAQDAAEYRKAALEEKSKEANSKAIQGEEKLKIQQQNADTASDRAGTYKLGTLERGRLGRDKLDFARLSLKEKNAVLMRGQDKNYQARLASMASRGAPQNTQAFKAAQMEFQQASMNYRNEKLNLNSSAESIEALADKALAAQQKMEAVVAEMNGGGEPGKPAAGGAPAAGAPAKEKIKPGEEVRYDEQGNAFVNRNGQAVPAEQ